VAIPALTLLVAPWAASLLACAEGSTVDAREVEIAAVIAAADESLIRSRPALIDVKYRRMAETPYNFLRGSIALFRNDMRSGSTAFGASRFALATPLVPSLGDPHLENFGLLRAADGSLALEPNDFDAADRAPYLWDVRRFASALAAASLISTPNDRDGARRVVTAAMKGYVSALHRRAKGVAPERFSRQSDSATQNAVVQDLFTRADRDAKQRLELAEYTELRDGVRMFRRGRFDPEDPESVLAPLPDRARQLIPQAVHQWQRSLALPLPEGAAEVLDAVREFGGGVASLARIRVLILLRGESDSPDDDVIVQLKELVDSGIAGLFPPGVYHGSPGQRVIATSRAAWSRPDAEPFWGATMWMGLPCQIRREAADQKSVRVARLTGDRAGADVLSRLGETLGALLARVHAAGSDGPAHAQTIARVIANEPDGFVDEQVQFALSYADQTLADHARFVRALARYGSRLGIPYDSADAPGDDFAALIGSAPAVPAKAARDKVNQ